MSSSPRHAPGTEHDHGHHHDHRHHHGHGRDHGGDERTRQRLWLALGLTATFLVAEVVVGFWSGSLALLSDAGHMLTDAAALGLALWAHALGKRPRTGSKTFGYRRAEILAAAANGLVLGLTALFVIVEAIGRFAAPPPIQAGPMLTVASLGLVVNLASAWVLSRGSKSDLNMRAAAAHVLGDAAGSVAAIVAGILIATVGWRIADPIGSIAISLLILVSAWRLVRDASHVLMEGAPAAVDVAALERLAAETPGVREVHDLHVWSIVADTPVVTAHVVLAPGHHGVEVTREVGRRITLALGQAHVTVQPEAPPQDDCLVPANRLVRS